MATSIGTSWATSPAYRVDDRDPARPAIISEKNRPIDTTKPALAKTARMPDAAPRWLAGTLFMIAAALGELNSPDPRPARSRKKARVG